MSSPGAYVPSSPLAVSTRRRSRFTFKQFNLLAQNSPTCPLRCIALIDYDAFYAQCEGVRLGIGEDQALAVQQWQGLIAINYPARKYGLNRHVTINEAKKACPQIICQHVATWREGDDEWRYRPDSFENIHTDKVSLDPYRLESRKSLALLKEALPAAPVQRVEKASIDEVFLDLSAQIHGILLERHPELRHAPYDDPSEALPKPPNTALDWQADGLVDLDEGEAEEDEPDWDDVIMNIGAEIVRGLRRKIFEKLKYTCSAGIARNKMMAKLGAGFKKPNQQTIVRNRAVQKFLSSFKFTKIRNLGGKLGDKVAEVYGTEEVSGLLKIPMDRMKKDFGDDTGSWLYGIIRGEDDSEVVTRTAIKSMLSAKSFRPSINGFDQAVKWMRIFTADIYARLVEEGVTENKRRPKTMNLSHRQGGNVSSKSLPIPMGKKIDREMLLVLATTLLQQVIASGKAWPCANLSLSVGGFEEGVTGNHSIGSFFVTGEAAKALELPPRSNSATPVQEDARPEKRRRLDGPGGGIGRFFKQESTGEVSEEQWHGSSDREDDIELPHKQLRSSPPPEPPLEPQQSDVTTFLCRDCSKQIAESERQEHEDWHFARSLQADDRSSILGPSNSRPPGPAVAKPKRGRPASAGARGGRQERNQSRLAFGST